MFCSFSTLRYPQARDEKHTMAMETMESKMETMESKMEVAVEDAVQVVENEQNMQNF